VIVEKGRKREIEREKEAKGRKRKSYPRYAFLNEVQNLTIFKVPSELRAIIMMKNKTRPSYFNLDTLTEEC
jgi:hypothetical protein